MKALNYFKLGISLFLALAIAACGDNSESKQDKGNAVETETITTESGLQYRVLTEGTGTMPKPEDLVVVHYTGRLLDGSVFDSSVERGSPSSFGVTQVIAGWTEALQLMREGAKWELTIPPELAYGERDTPTIPANSTLIFEVELIEVQTEEMMMNRWFTAQDKYLADNALKDGITVTESGVQYKVITKGPDGGESPSIDATVKVHYAGRLINGYEFDSSIKRGEPIDFGVTQVIPGWTEVLQLMKVGDKWEVTIPSSLAYGDGGSGPIPPKSTLVFDVELLAVSEPEKNTEDE